VENDSRPRCLHKLWRGLAEVAQLGTSMVRFPEEFYLSGS